MFTNARWATILITAVLTIHHVVAYLHGEVHSDIPVILSSWQNLFIYVVTMILPIVAVGLVWTRYALNGFLLLALSMAGSLLFGIYHHYILVSPDNIAHLPAAPIELHSQFIWTAHALAILQAVGGILAIYLLRTGRAA